MEVIFEKDGTKRKLEFQGTAKQLLLKLKVNPETVLVARNDEILDSDARLKDSDNVLIVSVVSGG
jgi:thiamine biosynthesis protein ThiS